MPVKIINPVDELNRSFAVIDPETGKVLESLLPDVSSGSLVKNLIVQRPISDQSLYPILITSQTSDFTSTSEINPKTSSNDRLKIKVFDGASWIDFPSEGGLGTPFDSADVSFDMSSFTYTEPYYIKYAWITEDGSESNYKGGMFPSSTIVSSIGNTESCDITTTERENISITSDMLDAESCYTVIAAKVADISVLDNNGKRIMPDLYQVGNDVKIDLEGFNISNNTWTIQFASGDLAISSFENAMNELIGEA